MTAVLIIKSFLFAHYKIYQGWSRYATFYDLVALAQASSASAVCLAVVDYLFLADWHTPRAVFIMDWAATIVVIGGLRSMHRWVEEAKSLFNSKDLARVLIIGADDTGENVLRAIRHGKSDRYYVVGFVAEQDSHERFIGGVPVVGSIDDTVELAKQFNATELLIASSSISGKLVRRIVDDASEHSIGVKVLPSFDQLFDGRVDMRPRTVSIEDLLRRDPVELDTEYVSEWLEGKTVLVTGSAGSIGSEMCRQILPFEPGHLVVVRSIRKRPFLFGKGTPRCVSQRRDYGLRGRHRRSRSHGRLNSKSQTTCDFPRSGVQTRPVDGDELQRSNQEHSGRYKEHCGLG